MHAQTLLIEGLKRLHSLKNDAELARRLGVAPPVISKMQHGKLPIGDSFLIRIHDAFDNMPITAIRALYIKAEEPPPTVTTQ